MDLMGMSKGIPTPLQEKFVKSGLKGFNDREAFELLISLCPCVEQREVPRKCIRVFENIRQLLSASPKELQQAGLNRQCVFYIKFLREIPAEVLRQKILKCPTFRSSREIFDYLYYAMSDLKEERFKVIYLDNRDRIIDILDFFEGGADTIYFHPRRIIENAIEHEAAALIFVHNHPSGDPTPSKPDKGLTRDFVFAGNILQIRVLDHIVIGDDNYFSFADEGLIQKYEDDFLNMRITRI